MVRFYSIGGLQLRLNSGALPLLPDPLMDAYRADASDAPFEGLCIDCCPADASFPTRVDRNFDSVELRTDADGNCWLVYCGAPGLFWGYRETELQTDHRQVFYDPALETGFNCNESSFLALCGLHTFFLSRKAAVMHAAYVDVGGKALLFSGPSGIGKSTQAELWCRHRGARLVNGDRALLRTVNGTPTACGYPLCGSSGQAENCSLPIAAVVFLAQAPENRVTPLSPSEALRQLIPALAAFRWREVEHVALLSTGIMLAGTTPFYRLACRPDADAVSTLAAALNL